MNAKTIFGWGVMIAVFFIINVVIGIANDELVPDTTDGRKLQWDRFDVTIDNFDTAANRFDVAEDYTITVERGPFRFGLAEIPLDRVERIADVRAYENGAPMVLSCSGTVNTICVGNDGKNLTLKYTFSSPMQNGETRRFRLEYTVYGALRSYEAGDELFWAALPEDLQFPVAASRVQVILNPSMTALNVTSYPDTWDYFAEGNVLTWDSPPRPSDDGVFEVRVKYPHDPAMGEPDWQAGYDREVWYKDNLQPFVTLLLVMLTGAVGFGGTLLVVMRYVLAGRDPRTITVPDYLNAPPNDEHPAVVGLLVDEKADMRDVMAVLIDLAQRGYIVIEQTQESVLGVFKSTDFTFHRTEKPADDLRGFERSMLDGLFPGRREETKLSDLKEKFYKHIGGIRQQLYTALVEAGYFTRSPETTRNLWIGVGIVGLIVATAWFWLLRGQTLISPVIWLPAFGIGAAGATALLFSNAMPAKTAKGAQQAALWRAFMRYLSNLDQYKDLKTASANFDQYMPYAVAFGVENDFVREVTPALKAMPVWYYPTYLGGPWDGGYHRRRHYDRGAGRPGGGLGDLSAPSAPSLSGLDRSLSEGLNAMSSGMTKMLNDASRAMTSRPSSSSSGGGFSGGGMGGSSGGGSRGFG